DGVQKSFHGAVEAGRFPGLVTVSTAQFAKELRLIRSGEILLAVTKADQPVLLAVHDQDGNFQAREFAARVVFDGAQPTHGQPRIYLDAELRQARESALQNEAAGLFAQA